MSIYSVKRQRINNHYFSVIYKNNKAIEFNRWNHEFNNEYYYEKYREEKGFNVTIYMTGFKISLPIEAEDYPIFIEIDGTITSLQNMEFWNNKRDELRDVVLNEFDDYYEEMTDEPNSFKDGFFFVNQFDVNENDLPSVEFIEGSVTEYSLWKTKKRSIKSFNTRTYTIDVSDLSE